MLPKKVYMKLSKRDKQKVKRNLVKGSGAYIYGKDKPFGHYGEKIGKYLGKTFNIPFARQLGAYGGHLIGKAFGSGAYYNSRGKYIPSYRGAHKMIRGSGAYYNAPKRVVTNATSPPSFGSNRTIVRHREFIGNILGSTSFSINSWNVNPGDETTFPWLSALAANYEKYRPIGVIFEFKSTSATALNSTNTALGTVMMAPRYNAVAQSAPGSKMEMLQIEGCTSICPAESAMCGIECAKNYNPLGVLYIRNQNQGIVGSEQLYDFCDFYLATDGMQASATIGELWVTYEIELLTPILAGGQVGDTINFSNYMLGSSISTTNYFASPSDSLNVSNMELTYGSNYFQLPTNIVDGCYMAVYHVYGISTVGVSAPGLAFTNAVTLQIVLGNTVGYQVANGTVPTMNFVFYFRVTGSNARVTFTGGTLPTSISAGQLIVSQIPDQ